MGSPLPLNLSSDAVYRAQLHTLRETIKNNRDGHQIVEVSAPVNASPFYVAINRRDIYLDAFRPDKGIAWYYFKRTLQKKNKPEVELPPPKLSDPSALVQLKFGGDYGSLMLNVANGFSLSPAELLANLVTYFPTDGSAKRLGENPYPLHHLIGLIFAVSEALRFQEMEDTMAKWCSNYYIELKHYDIIVNDWQNKSGVWKVLLEPPRD